MSQDIKQKIKIFETVLDKVPEIRYAGDLVLRQTTSPATHEEGLEIGKRLETVLLKYREITGWGRGLAAPQIGESKSVFITYLDNQFEVFINPKILEKSNKSNFYKELCMSAGVIATDVERPDWIVVEWMDEKGTTKSKKFDGFKARLYQHEEAHLRGRLNLDDAVSGGIEFVTLIHLKSNCATRNKYMEISEQLISTIKNLPKPTVVAVSGFGGSGKSTVAKKLAEKLGAPVIGVDSFQKKGAFDTQFSLWGIMDFVRLEEQVFKPFFKKENVIRYGNFNAKTETISETVEFKNEEVLVIEGVGLFRPELANYLSYKIWVDVPLEEAVARGKKRDREEYHNPTDECWDGVWKENDLEYYTTFKPKESANFVLKNI